MRAKGEINIMAWTITALDFLHDPTDLLSRDGFDRLYPRPLKVDDGNGNLIDNPDLLLSKIQWRKKCLKAHVREVAVAQKDWEQKQALAPVVIPVEE